MRASYVISGAVAFVLVAAVYQTGCFFVADFEDCSLYPHAGCPGGTSTGSSSSSTSSTSSSTSSTGGPDCSGDPSSTNVVDACGVFARADATAGGDGTMAKPFVKLADAIVAAESAGRRVYACSSQPFNEAVTIGSGIQVYGGLDCTKGWTWSQSARSQLNGPADTVALTVTNAAGGAVVEGFTIVGASPSDLTMGGSSIAVAVDDVAATLDHCDVTASDAADGVAGVTPSGMATPGASAPALMATGAPTPACVLPAGVTGGAPAVTTCSDGMTSGGVGGTGGITGTNGGDGQQGTNGSPLPSPNPTMAGLGGVGQTDPVDPTKVCQKGQDGLSGSAGSAGPGGSAAGDQLSLTGIANSDMTGGQSGTKAQGGGGGGGAMSGTFCTVASMTVDGPGASGGGGGAGGCGGMGGGGGSAGGSSIAIVSLGSKLTLTSVTLSVGKGGKGGGGALNQAGASGGVGATGGAGSGIGSSNPGCNGGNGGKGGNGGPGGGGRGGHAIGIAYAKAPATMPAIQMFTPGLAGNGGTAGSGAPATSNGANGNQGQCWDFSAGTVCQ